MNNKITIVLKNSDEYTFEERRSNVLYQVGIECNGKIYYFDGAIKYFPNVANLFDYFRRGNQGNEESAYSYGQYKKVFTKISAEYQSNWLFNKVLADEVIYTKKEEKDVIKDIKNKSVNNSNNVKKQESQQTRVQNTSNERKFYNMWINHNISNRSCYGRYDTNVDIQEDPIYTLFGNIKGYRFNKTVKIIAEEKNGRYFDIITGDEFYYVGRNSGESSLDYEEKCLQIDGITYMMKLSIKEKEVLEQLNMFNKDPRYVVEYKRQIEILKDYKRNIRQAYLDKIKGYSSIDYLLDEFKRKYK